MLRFYDNKIYYNLNSWYMLTSIFPGKKNNIDYMENMMGVKTKATKTKSVKTLSAKCNFAIFKI